MPKAILPGFLVLACLVSVPCLAVQARAGQGFELNDETGKHLDVLLDGHVAARYMYAYVFPKENPNCHKDLDYPWVGETYVLDGKKYSIVDINPPTNPRKTRWSAYRDYGRFGAFPVAKIKKGQSLQLDYRFLIADGEMPSAELIQKSWDEFAHAATASPVPTVTVVLAEQPAAQPRKPAKAKAKGSNG